MKELSAGTGRSEREALPDKQDLRYIWFSRHCKLLILFLERTAAGPWVVDLYPAFISGRLKSDEPMPMTWKWQRILVPGRLTAIDDYMS